MRKLTNDNFHHICMRESGSLFEALEILQHGAGIAVILDEGDSFLGLLTDGDLRRALLNKAQLSDSVQPFVNHNVIVVKPETPRAEVLDLMQARWIEQIPIVSSEGRVMGIHLLHEVLGSVSRPNTAVIMAGGRGTRLGALTQKVPKPMLKVAGRPILERLLLHFLSYGIRDFYFSVQHLSEVIESHFGDGARFGCSIRYLREEEPLGTCGALSLLPAAPEHPMLVCNGDLVTEANVDALLDYHTAHENAVTAGVKDYTHEIPFGCVDLEGDRIVALREKPTISKVINAGIYVLSPRVVSTVPRRFFPMTDLIDQCLQNGDRVGAWHIETEWIDVGQQHDLARARTGT
ncbi:MAG: nucleotidyltransferase family protein [Candidatus Methylacidiphilales bacterium]|nr:nucleotidyltransferase family protein [Candidatus Methylacidiphilales bacterium]